MIDFFNLSSDLRNRKMPILPTLCIMGKLDSRASALVTHQLNGTSLFMISINGIDNMVYCYRSCGKVMFLQACVILFIGGCLVLGGVWCQGGVPGPGGVPGGDPPGTATAAGGTHPTGMHSCMYCSFGP